MIQQCIDELEIKLSFQEDLLQTLNQVITQQQRQLDAMAKEVDQLKACCLDFKRQNGVGISDIIDKPPHY